MNSDITGLPVSSALDASVAVAAALHVRVFVVGGVVRDLVSGRPPGDYDLDVVVEGDGGAYAHALQRVVGGELKIFPAFLTAKILAPFASQSAAIAHEAELSEVDVASTRTEVYEKPAALPKVQPAKIEEDLFRRDFSINAMALPLGVYRTVLGNGDAAEARNHIVDPAGGLADLNARLVRILHERSFEDDPTRLFRALRYCARLGFALSAETRSAFNAAVAAERVSGLSPRRVWNELVASLDEARPQDVVASFISENLLSAHKLLEAGDLPLLTERLSRLAELSAVSGAIRKEAGRLVLLHIAVRAGRDGPAKSVQEGKRALERASSIDREEALADVALMVARYAVTGDERAKERVMDLVRK